jgi:hypothetical protein
MQRQLSILDSLQPLDTALTRIRTGDWVKLKKDAVGAIDWGAGEVLQIESIDPASGRARFWNDRVQEWGYLRSADMALTLPPLKVLKNQPISPVEEPPTPPVVAESEVVSGEIDSATGQPIALVAESGLAPQPLVAESEPAPGEINSATRSVSTYRPKGTARGGEYFRFVYRAGTRIRSVHVPGGNTGSVLAQSRAAEVMELAAAGVPSLEICDRIKSWSKKNHLETE